MDYFLISAQFLTHNDCSVNVHGTSEWMMMYIFSVVWPLLLPLLDKKHRICSFPKITQKMDSLPTQASRNVQPL